MAPAMMGEEKEVPLPCETLPFPEITVVPCPWAVTSGLVRPSAVGPVELKEA
jgi:hypothetical protein